MSTLLTPIIAQLELDRDRLKGLVNGEVGDTVELEGRIERSIAGQVQFRIDQLAFDLEEAVTLSQTAAQASTAARDEAEGFRDEAEGFRDDAANAATSAATSAGQASQYLSEFDERLEEAIISMSDPTRVFTTIPLYPYEDITGDTPVENLHLMGTPLDLAGNRAEFVGRRFQIIQLASGYQDGDEINIDDHTIIYNENGGKVDSVFIGDTLGLTAANRYAWRFIDSVYLPDARTPTDFPPAEEGQTNFVEEFDSPWSVFRVATGMARITSAPNPTVTVSGNDVQVGVAYPAITGGTGNAEFAKIQLVRNGKAVADALLNAPETSYNFENIPYGEYEVKVQYVRSGSAPNTPVIFSPWSNNVIASVLAGQAGGLVSEYTSITAESNIEYDLQTLLGIDHDSYDKKSANIIVRVLDDDSTSNTYQSYVNSEAVIKVALASERYVRLYNTATDDLDVSVFISVPRLT